MRIILLKLNQFYRLQKKPQTYIQITKKKKYPNNKIIY